MACCLFGTKPLPESMITYCQLFIYKQTFNEIWIKIQCFFLRKYIWNCRLRNVTHFVQASKCLGHCDLNIWLMNADIVDATVSCREGHCFLKNWWKSDDGKTLETLIKKFMEIRSWEHIKKKEKKEKETLMPGWYIVHGSAVIIRSVFSQILIAYSP